MYVKGEMDRHAIFFEDEKGSMPQKYSLKLCMYFTKITPQQGGIFGLLGFGN